MATILQYLVSAHRAGPQAIAGPQRFSPFHLLGDAPSRRPSSAPGVRICSPLAQAVKIVSTHRRSVKIALAIGLGGAFVLLILLPPPPPYAGFRRDTRCAKTSQVSCAREPSFDRSPGSSKPRAQAHFFVEATATPSKSPHGHPVPSIKWVSDRPNNRLRCNGYSRFTSRATFHRTSLSPNKIFELPGAKPASGRLAARGIDQAMPASSAVELIRTRPSGRLARV